jgi:pantoate--beta-alanine ligase
MNIFQNIEDIRKQRWADGAGTWGLVPTMGFLHEGHLSLVRRARRENDRVGVSIFVNPTQFNDQKDLAQYPQDLDRDLQLLGKEGVDLVWTPTVQQVYHSCYQTYVDVEEVTRRLEGQARPGHFRGVATVVAKLFNVFQPDRSYFGQKDGSRNANLSPEARKQAICLYRALLAAKGAIKDGERSTNEIKARMRESLDSFELARVEYVSIAHPGTLDELEEITGEALVSLAVFVAGIRLIDNMVLTPVAVFKT